MSLGLEFWKHFKIDKIPIILGDFYNPLGFVFIYRTQSVVMSIHLYEPKLW